MLFHTYVFLIFFLIVYPVYFLIRHNNRATVIWLLLASYTFYGWWNPAYMLLLFATSAIDYWMVLLMERNQRTRKLWLIISLVSNFGFLAFFKYSYFLTENLNVLLSWAGISFQLWDPVHYPNAIMQAFGSPKEWLFTQVVLPIGISFHTFQSMSYTIDAYRGSIKTERSFLRFLTFVSFFPQLVAGPIERAGNLLPQLQNTPTIRPNDLAQGASHFLVGLFKKAALADYLSHYVDPIYSNPEGFSSGALLLATFAFAWQIYFDFSGYTDMARGIAQMMGYRLMLNFNNPYVATGLGDFWSRWHISLSTWFKDYVYFPLGGNRGGKLRTYRNMVLTMLISGAWHGANWGFVIWGALHAAGRVLTREAEATSFYRNRVPVFVKQMAVFAFVCLTWVFFRCQTWEKSWLVLSRMVTAGWADPKCPPMLLGMVLLVWIYQYLFARGSRTRRLLEWGPLRVAMATLMLAYILIVAQSSSATFIYFDF